jgi:hypothetical protein
MTATFRLWGNAVALGTALAACVLVDAQPAAAQTCGCASYQIVNKVVYDQVPVTAYRLEYETVMDEQQVTTLRPEWTEEIRERRHTVAKPVSETATREERFVVRKPVYETSFREEAYDRVSYVNETEMRQQKYLVQRPVSETQMREQQVTVRRAVQETVMQDQAYTAYQPVVSYHTQQVDQGQYVTALQPTAPKVRNRLWCMPGGYQVDPATGTAAYYRGGLRWVPTQGPTVMQPVTTYMPNIVTQQVATTTMQPVQMTQQVPVTVNRLVDEVVTQQIPVTVNRMETQEVVQEIPVTVQRPVTERIVNKIPIQTVRYEDEEHVRQVPYTVQRIEYEEVVEQIPVRVCRYVNETKAVQVPRTVSKLVPYQTTRLQPRVVTMRVPIGGYESSIYEGPTTRYYYGTPVQAVPAAPSKAQSVLRSPVQAPTAPQGVLRPQSNGAGPNGSTTKRVEPNQAPQKTDADKPEESPSDRAKEEADRAPALPLNPPEGSARQTSTDRQA